jgi:hypothetical protein
MNWDSSVGKVSGYGLDDRVRFPIPTGILVVTASSLTVGPTQTYGSLSPRVTQPDHSFVCNVWSFGLAPFVHLRDVGPLYRVTLPFTRCRHVVVPYKLAIIKVAYLKIRILYWMALGLLQFQKLARRPVAVVNCKLWNVRYRSGS